MSTTLSWRQFFPFVDLRDYTPKSLSRDAMAALGVAFLGVPQGVAYALIAGLPPVMGLYAATIPTIIGSLMRPNPYEENDQGLEVARSTGEKASCS